ncbi:MAG: hypothetical protein IT281_00795 [Ignavibacteria bacterium]|nr:hypothetical protein [Ignavibacteria bacterium]
MQFLGVEMPSIRIEECGVKIDFNFGIENISKRLYKSKPFDTIVQRKIFQRLEKLTPFSRHISQRINANTAKTSKF